MPADIEELISALTDGELDAETARRVVDEVSASPRHRARLARYHLIGEAARGGLCLPLSADLPTALARALEAPEPSDGAPDGDLPRRRARKRDPGSRRWAPAAIAASLLAAGALGFLAARQLPPDAGPPPVAEAGPAGSVPATVAAGARSTRPWKGRWDTEHPSVQRRLQGYLVSHSEYVGRGVQGMHPYARVVTYQGSLADAGGR
jgi:sigma-E factor negative regulatory protein RseA